jgi:hypothetical protein
VDLPGVDRVGDGMLRFRPRTSSRHREQRRPWRRCEPHLIALGDPQDSWGYSHGVTAVLSRRTGRCMEAWGEVKRRVVLRG